VRDARYARLTVTVGEKAATQHPCNRMHYEHSTCSHSSIILYWCFLL